MSTERGESLAKRRTPLRVILGGLPLLVSGALALGALGSLSACPGDLVDPARFEDASSPQSCTERVTAEFATVCAVSGCHTTADMAGSLDLESPDVYARLLGKSASGGPGVLIDPSGDPDASVLYLKLTPDPPFGSQMPLVGAKLDAKTLACFASWIMMGSSMPDGGQPADSSSADSAADSASPEDGAADSESDGASEGASSTDSGGLTPEAGGDADAGD